MPTLAAQPLPHDLGVAIRERRAAIADRVIAAVAPELPAFGDPDGLPFAGGLQLAVEATLDELAAEIAEGRAPPAREIDYRLGRGQSLALRPLGELLTAYRVGGRTIAAELAALATELGHGPEVADAVGEAVRLRIDEYSVRVADGYADGRLASAGSSQSGRAHLVRRMILRSEDRDGWTTIARGVGWRIPATIACAAVRAVDWEPAGEPPRDLLAGPVDELICVIVSEPAGSSGAAALERLTALPLAVLGPTVEPGEAPHSFARAAALIRADLLAPGAGLVRADDNLHELALLAIEPRLATDFLAARLAPLDALGDRKGARIGETVRVWLSRQGHYEPTAAALGIHPQTVRYRINQAREAFGTDFDDPARRDEIRLALQLREARRPGGQPP